MKKIKKLLFILLILFSITLIGSCVNNNNKETINNIDYSNSKISFLGPKGTYSEEACEVYFENKGTYIAYNTVNEAIDELNSSKVDYAVVPVENTIGGITDYLDLVLTNEKLYVVGEVELTINQNLLTINDSNLSDIKTIYSHKQGILQSKEWINKNIPNAEIIEVSSTAEGAKLVSEKNDKSVAAIASTGAAKVYNLKILSKNIQENDNNKTRFYVLSKEKEDISSDRLAFVAKGNASDLSTLMSNIKSNNKKIITLHDKPLKTTLGEYKYLIELENCNYDEYLKITNKEKFDFRFLGTFNIKQS